MIVEYAEWTADLVEKIIEAAAGGPLDLATLVFGEPAKAIAPRSLSSFCGLIAVESGTFPKYIEKFTASRLE